MEEKEIKLESLFRQLFPSLRDLDDLSPIDMSTVPEWDSLTHMSLMLTLGEEFGLKELTGEDFARLISFKNILSFIRKE
jgi:acyl carrier protein